jgi:hypothetical protein
MNISGNIWIIIGAICGLISIVTIPYGFHLKSREDSLHILKEQLKRPLLSEKSPEINIGTIEELKGSKANNHQSKLSKEEIKANLEVSQRKTFYEGSEDNRTQINLLFRNLSPRPTAIVDLYVREENGIIGGRGYENRIKLPIQIEAWGIKQVDFRIDPGDEKRMTNILVKDMEDNEIIIRNTGEVWTGTNPPK